jgi:hypothetical protein
MRLPTGHGPSLSRCAGEECCDDVGGVSVEGDSSSVIPHGGARVSVAGGFLHVAKWNTGIEGGGDERVPQGVRADPLVDAGAAGDASHDPRRGMSVDPFTVRSGEDGSFAAFTDREVDGACGPRCERDRHDLAALAQNREGAVAALEPTRFDVGADRFGDPQSVQRQQADEPMITRTSETSRDQHGADFVTVQSSGMGVVVKARAPDVHRG